MSTRDHIWALVAKRLANKATEDEIRKLDEFLKRYSDTDSQIKVIADHWRKDNQEEIAQRGALILKKIKEKINARNDQ
jgi:chromosome segregation and condensation protein ScpB